MVDEAVDHGGGDDFVAEDFAPASEGQVGGDQDRALFVAGRDELEEQVRGVGVEGDVADLVDDDQLVAADLLQLGLQSAGVVGGGQAGDPVGGGVEQDAVPGLGGLDAQPEVMCSGVENVSSAGADSRGCCCQRRPRTDPLASDEN